MADTATANADVLKQGKVQLQSLDVAPPPPFRHLDRGFSCRKVSAWAELRTCSQTGHNALYAAKAFKAGDTMHEFGAKVILGEPNFLTVQISATQHIMLNPEWLQYINHSCAPNCLLDPDLFALVALKDIEADEELGFFYCATEWSMQSPFGCMCNQEGCIRQVQGAKFLPYSVISKYRISKYIRAKAEERRQQEEAEGKQA